MNSKSYVIITSLKQKDDDAYATFNSAIDQISVGNGIRFSVDSILIRFDGNLEKLFMLVNEHVHDGDEIAIFPVSDGRCLFCEPQTEVLFRQVLKGD